MWNTLEGARNLTCHHDRQMTDHGGHDLMGTKGPELEGT
jgi:hypothetical protein